MNYKKKFNHLLLALFILTGCTQGNINTAPDNSNNQSETEVPNSSSPTPSPVVEESPSSETPSPEPSVSESPNSDSNNQTSDIISKATLNGKVYDEGGEPLDGVKVTAESVDEGIEYFGETLTSGGTYVFRNVPAGSRVKLTAFKELGWTTKDQTVVVKSNTSGDPNANIVDFGDFFNINDINKLNFNFLTDAPQVVEILPKYNTSIDHTNLQFGMTFSEPVKKDFVEKNFIVRYTNSKVTSEIILGNGENGTNNTDGPPKIKGFNQFFIDRNTTGTSFQWDTDGFDDYGTTFTFKVPSTTGLIASNEFKVNYGISLRGFNNGSTPIIEDKKQNVALNKGEFFLNNRFSRNSTFLTNVDRTQPRFSDLDLLEINNQKVIRLIFSEPMEIAGSTNKRLRDKSTYKFFKNQSLFVPNILEINSPVQNQIELVVDNSSFDRNDLIQVDVDLNVKDPSGNFISAGVTGGDRDYSREKVYVP